MQDFATLLLQARGKAGLTQAQLAQAAGLTPSYLSFIENRKKPPPSDTVCTRLAAVLGVSASKLIETAHMERAPQTVQKRVNTLRSTLKRERKSRNRVLQSLLSPFLFAGTGEFFAGMFDSVSLTPKRRRRLREVMTALGRKHHDQVDEVSRIVEELPDRDRELLLDALPQILGTGSLPAGDPGDASPPTTAQPYQLAVDESCAAGAPDDIRAGDQLIVDPRLTPRAEDLIVIREGEALLVRRLVATEDGTHHTLAGRTADADARLLDETALAAFLERFGAGTVIEIRRPLRRA